MDYLVNFRSVQTPLNDQFSIGANNPGFRAANDEKLKKVA
jgi:hypothetical protein